ncbi:MAG: family 43 glycosylhydrolase [Bacteroidales bacterium]|nr:family 43 glycosylhydrolase [Bacteroidales bacterium]
MTTKPNFLRMRRSLCASLILCFTLVSVIAQPPSHDPSTMIRNTDGRYWIFTTGNGIWCMSSSNSNFTDWRAETAPFANGYPSWIKNYVSGFTGSFWAPDVIKIGSTYYLYYSCAGSGTAAAIGVATATNLRGPWTDKGMVVAGNNAIDPAVYYDNGRLWMAWGNWVSGIDICELNPSTGKRLNSTSYHLVSGEVEGPGLIKHGDYYFLFYQRGLCCNGVNSTYYIVVARSTSITGPYTGEKVFVPNRSGNIIGPGHFGYGEGKLTYHYYDGNDNGAAKLKITTMGYAGGYPVAGITSDDGSCTISSTTDGIFNGTYAIRPTHSNKALDVYAWGTSNGTNIVQWSYWGGATQQFNITPVDGIWHRITPVLATDKALDVYNISTADGANINIWSYWGGNGQQFRFQSAGSGKWRIINRNSGKCVDVEGSSTADGANVFQWTCISGAANQMFQLVSLKSAENTTGVIEKDVDAIGLYPNPVVDRLYINLPEEYQENISVAIFNSAGTRLVSQDNVSAVDYIMDVGELKAGIYFIMISNGKESITEKFSKK